MRSNREVLRGFVAVEGIDGAGTTTQTALLCRAMSDAGVRVLQTSEPTSGAIGRIIREILSGSLSALPQTVAYLFAADRNEHVNASPHGIREQVANGAVVVSDRYFFSSLAYQTVDADWDFVESLNAGFPVPEVLVFVDVPVDRAIERLSSRVAREIYEHREFQLTVARHYERALTQYAHTGMTVVRVDGDRDQDDIRSRIFRHPAIVSIVKR